MGGDDLGDDDDYLFAPVVVDDNDGDDEVVDEHKRSLDETKNDEDAEPATKKRKKLSNEAVLIQAGCGIESSSVEEQISFLTTSLKHYTMLAAAEAGNETPVVESDVKLTTKSLVCSSKDTLPERLRDVVSLKRLKKHRAYLQHIQSRDSLLWLHFGIKFFDCHVKSEWNHKTLNAYR